MVVVKRMVDDCRMSAIENRGARAPRKKNVRRYFFFFLATFFFLAGFLAAFFFATFLVPRFMHAIGPPLLIRGHHMPLTFRVKTLFHIFFTSM